MRKLRYREIPKASVKWSQAWNLAIWLQSQGVSSPRLHSRPSLLTTPDAWGWPVLVPLPLITNRKDGVSTRPSHLRCSLSDGFPGGPPARSPHPSSSCAEIFLPAVTLLETSPYLLLPTPPPTSRHTHLSSTTTAPHCSSNETIWHRGTARTSECSFNQSWRVLTWSWRLHGRRHSKALGSTLRSGVSWCLLGLESSLCPFSS